MRRKTIISLSTVLILVVMIFAMTGCAEQIPREPTTYEKNTVTNEKAVENLIKNIDFYREVFIKSEYISLKKDLKGE